MKFLSTRGQAAPVCFSDAIVNGIATDGGLYFPDKFPHFDASLQTQWAADSLVDLSPKILSPWLKEDPLEKLGEEICKKAFNFPIPLVYLSDDTAVLELFHGPTAAFKDVGARFLAESLGDLPKSKNRIVLVATSGDTGGAVAAAFFGKPNISVVILYPENKVTQRQELQLTTWGGNIHAYAVRGDFDDCQKLVKALLVDPTWQGRFLSANSINLGRLLPQSFYYAHSSLNYFKKRGRPPGYVVPTGNLGNAVAALWAKQMGFPIREVVFATNSNRAISDYLETTVWQPQANRATLANAMDVGNPSNIERLFQLYPKIENLKKDVRAFSVSDLEIQQAIVDGWKDWKQIFCPHTATAASVRRRKLDQDWIIVATAHPAKFEQIVEPLLHQKVELPESLKSILAGNSNLVAIHADLEKLKTELKSKFS